MLFDFRGDELRLMSEFSYFKQRVEAFYTYMVDGSSYTVTYSKLRLELAFEFWGSQVDDFQRMLGGEPCQYKRAAALTYWLYRECPVSDWSIDVEKVQDLSPRNKQLNEYLRRYGREICAFRLGFELAGHYRRYEDRRKGISPDYGYSEHYVNDLIYFLKRGALDVGGLYLSLKAIYDP